MRGCERAYALYLCCLQVLTTRLHRCIQHRLPEDPDGAVRVHKLLTPCKRQLLRTCVTAHAVNRAIHLPCNSAVGLIKLM